VRQHLVGFAAEQQGGDTATTMRGHENQVAAGFGRSVDDRLIGNVTGQRQLGDLDTLGRAEFDDEIQRLLGLLLSKFGKLLGRRRVDQRPFTIISDRVFRFGEERRNARASLLGEGNCPTGSVLGKLGAVGRDKDVAESFRGRRKHSLSAL
jgi:hypothetical protein